ncbi:cupin domain-containing protein [Neotabrizicola shimadae]|uniref:Cupin domain-containing protein n=1 Tax=Neotabrizicola shimadae TaxID=2807096 RepID=A0A8G0ZUA4_9RHOB|nr:cupin domain-containing protein [Neotabrizicola shimadae]QYZ68917.1 cupin domain-containing protein [Neotabrizicola shimadae]
MTHPGWIAAGEDRFGTPLRFLNGRFDVKVSAVDTDGALAVIDTLRDMPGGPPVHVHEAQDEWFLVLEGEVLFRVGERIFRAGPGDSVFGPRGVPHAFRVLAVPTQMILVFQPAARIEDFFASGMTLGATESAAFDALSLEHGIRNIAPPLRGDEGAQGDSLAR